MGAPPNSLPPLPLQGGNQPTPATSPNAPMSGIMNFIKAIGGGLANMGTGGALGMQKEHEGFAQKQTETAEATAYGEKQADTGQPFDVAAFVASGGNPNLGQWLAETAKQKAAQNAQFANAIGAIPGLDDRTRATIQAGFASGDPKQEELSKLLLTSYASQAKNAAEIQGRQITAGATEQAAKTRAKGETESAGIRAGATMGAAKIGLQKEREEGVWKTQIAKIGAAAKSGAQGALGKAQKEAATAYKGVISKDAQGNPHPERLDNYNTRVMESMPFGDAVSTSYGFKGTDEEGNQVPLQQTGMVGFANELFKGYAGKGKNDTSAVQSEAFLADYNKNIKGLPPNEAVPSMLAKLQGLVRTGKISETTGKQMMQQYLAAAQQALQAQQAGGGAALYPSAPADDSEDRSEDQAKDESPDAGQSDNTNDND